MAKSYRGVVSFPKSGRTWLRLFFQYYGGQIHFTHKVDRDGYPLRQRILLIRNPCDVMVSWYFHLTVRMLKNFTLPQLIRDPRGLRAYNEFHKEVTHYDQSVIRYEDLFEVETWYRIVKCLELPLDEKRLHDCFEQTRFDKVRENLKGLDWHYMAKEEGRKGPAYIPDPVNPEAHKLRRGKVGGFVDYMEKEDIKFILDNFSLGKLKTEEKAYKEMIGGMI